MRTDILDKLVAAVDNTDDFVKVYKGYLPPVPSVPSFPAAAFVIESEERRRINVPGCQFESVLTITGMIYAKADKTKSAYSDAISSLIYSVEDAIQGDSDLNDLTIDIYVKTIAQDGGLLYPYELCELSIIAYYRK